MNKIEKDKAYVWHPFDVLQQEQNIFIKKATGVHLHTNDGKKIIDAISSWWVNIHGHRNQYISRAVAKQLRYFEHVIFAGFTHDPAIRLAESLVKILPGSMAKVFFSDDGSTSTEVAIKMALQYWFNKGEKKNRIIAFEGAYHGDTFGAMSVGARGGFNEPFEAHLFDVAFIPLPESADNETFTKFEILCQTCEIAAFIYEPLIQGSAGMRMYLPEMLEKLLQIAKANKVICIADEVFTGFGRTGKNFASEYCETKPDIICLSKALTGGYLPLGVTATQAHVYEAFSSKEMSKIFLHGHSYTANPLACAAANESIRLFLTVECQQNIARLNATFELWKIELSTLSNIKNIRCLGAIFAFEVINEKDSGYFNPLRERLYKAFIDKNILIRPLGNTVYVLPPYIIAEKELNYILKSIKEVLADF
ncbi:MAG: adenosylmethionine--8-amino-7-oxononanoate transaminase [Cytophagales bacterium]